MPTIRTRLAVLASLAACLSGPAMARTPAQDAAVDRYWALTEACRAGDRDAGQCEMAREIKASLEADGLCFVWGEGDGFASCETTPAAPQDTASVHFRGSVFEPVFNQMLVSDRKAVQRRLQAAGTYDGAIDGIYGKNTARAVRVLAERVETETGADLDMRTPGGVREAIGRIMTFEGS